MRKLNTLMRHEMLPYRRWPDAVFTRLPRLVWVLPLFIVSPESSRRLALVYLPYSPLLPPHGYLARREPTLDHCCPSPRHHGARLSRLLECEHTR